MPHSAFGQTLKTLRAELGLSQSALALAIDSTQRHVSFLETGRSAPSREMVSRITSQLSLSAGQGATLFEASGFRYPDPSADFEAGAMNDVLDRIERHVLGNWPFPGFVLDAQWNVLRSNPPADVFLGNMFGGQNTRFNLLQLFLSAQFRQMIQNWDEASTALYFRMQAAAAQSPDVAELLGQAMREGHFDGVKSQAGQDVPIYVPIALQVPGVGLLQVSSMLGRLASVHDAAVEGFEIELMTPMDVESEMALRAMLGVG